MISFPRTQNEARKCRYGQWAGEPAGTPYDEGRCAFEVPYGGRSVRFHQCFRAPGKGLGGLYCGIHAKKVESK